MGIDVDEASYLTNLIPSERGQTWSLRDAYFGNEEEDRKPVKELLNAVSKHEGLKEISLKIENKIKNSSVHASGIYIFNEPYTKHNAMMKASSGIETTQFDMKDSDAMSALKVDGLTVSNIDKIRTTMNMLIEDGYMEWQGSLRETYNKYLHPKVLEYDDPEMWKKVADNSIPDLFQFDTTVGLQTAQKTKPTNVKELSSANNLMRLASDGEQPVDKYVKHKQDPSLMRQEFASYNLTDEEIEVVLKHLGEKMAVSDSQEDLMLLSMDEKISGFSIPEANKLRKAVSKKNPVVFEEVRQLFYEKGLKRTSKNMLDYIWEQQVMPQRGYGFSVNHSASYSLIALQNMNLAHKYPSVYWETACLIVNSASDENSNTNKTGDVGRIAIAVGEMQQRGTTVNLPDINRAGYTFKADGERDQVLYGLKPISGIGDDIAHTIISNRPYDSFQDFLTRMIDTKLVQNSQMLQLIKAGCFDSFGSRKDIMKQYLTYVFEPRKKITLASFNLLNELNIFPEEFELHIRFYNFRKYISKHVYSRSKSRKTKNRLFTLDGISTEFLYEHFSDECIVDFDEESGLPIVAEWLFEREYEQKMKVVKEWLDKDSTTQLVNERLFELEWNKAGGNNSISKNEMSSLSYYYSGHELEHLNHEKYSVTNFSQLPAEPISVRQYQWKGREMNEYQISRIAGTVLDKDKNRHTVTILTTDGVVTVKMYRSQYSYLDRQISRINSDGTKTVLEKSWLTRGTLLLITGYRRGNQFVPKVYKSTIFQKPVVLINSIDDEGNLSLSEERVSAN